MHKLSTLRALRHNFRASLAVQTEIGNALVRGDILPSDYASLMHAAYAADSARAGHAAVRAALSACIEARA
jgi:hypothetical protein